MSKIYTRNILRVVLLCVILFFVVKERSPFGTSNSSFAVDPDKDITLIELREGNKKLTIEKVKEEWVVNGEYNTRKSSILFIMKILKEINIKSPVSPELFSNEVTKKGINPVRVRVYENKRLLKSFIVYKTTSNIYGNIMKLRSKSKPFITYIPGYEINIGSAFILNELFWQPHTLFNLLPSEISSVALENFSDTTASFSIINKNLKSVITGSGSALTGWDSSRIRRYLSYFAWVPFENWAFDISQDEKDKIKSEQPSIKLSVTDKNNKKRVLILWEREKFENGIKVKDLDRLWGKSDNSEELFIIRYFDVDPLLKKRSYFFPE